MIKMDLLVDGTWIFKLSKFGWSVLPYLISLVGVLSDYLTTTLGLDLGFYESNPFFNTLLAVAIFWGTLAFLNLMLPKGKVWTVSKDIFVLVSFLGAINNTLVIAGVFPGL